MPALELPMDAEEIRVLACLIEKEITTPEYYPLTLNALTNACNQKSNRDPIVSWDEGQVEDAFDRLRARRLVSVIIPAGSRARKYMHQLSDVLNLGRREIAVLCTLLLRGPQTLNEIMTRSERMHAFTGPDEVETVLGKLAEFEGGALAVKLPKLPGTKEPRYTHLLAGEPDIATMGEEAAAPRQTQSAAIEQLTAEVAALRTELERLSREFAEFRARFE